MKKKLCLLFTFPRYGSKRALLATQLVVMVIMVMVSVVMGVVSVVMGMPAGSIVQLKQQRWAEQDKVLCPQAGQRHVEVLQQVLGARTLHKTQ